MKDKQIGLCALVVLSALYLYFTVWIIVMPFVDKTASIQTWFPNRLVGIQGAVVFGVVLLTIVMSFVGLVLIRHSHQ